MRVCMYIIAHGYVTIKNACKRFRDVVMNGAHIQVTFQFPCQR